MFRRILVTGAGSGLGHAVHGALGGIAVTRSTGFPEIQTPEAQPYEAIIHCAINTAKSVQLSAAYSYFDDNVLLTQRLLGIPHRRFVLISSVDLYSKDSTVPARPDDDCDVAQLSGLYAATKLFSDVLVRTHGKRPLILRPTTLLGSVMRPNSTYRLLTERHCNLFVSPRSRFNFVLHGDIVRFIDHALRHDVEGVFNLASSSSIELGDIAAQLGLSPRFGSYDYNVGVIDQEPAAAINPAFARPSWRTLNTFIDELGTRFVGSGRLVQGTSEPLPA